MADQASPYDLAGWDSIDVAHTAHNGPSHSENSTPVDDWPLTVLWPDMIEERLWLKLQRRVPLVSVPTPLSVA